MNYTDFLGHKKPIAPAHGFKGASLPKSLFDWQKEAVSWTLELGRAALLEECGLGKTPQQLAWSQAVSEHENAPTLILAPLAVAAQTAREGEKFGVEVTVCRDAKDVAPGVNISNYDSLHKFDLSRFAGIALDESSILKSFSGPTKRGLVEGFKDTPYRLACTATPAPNDYMEIGNHAEFLGIMPSNEMLARWFINDTANFGSYRLKKYAEVDFWEWVSSWAICLTKPSDLTGNAADDAGYDLPPLHEHTHIIEVDATEGAGDRLFRSGDLSATGMHREKRLTLDGRVAQSAKLANNSDESWIVWCETNDESDALARAIPDSVEVRGSDSNDAKERKLMAFTDGEVRVIVTKPSIAGWGLNWQHCPNVLFSSLTFSFEGYYQAVRRAYRFGQQSPVHVHLVAAQTEAAILDTLRAKRQSHERMQAQMSAAMRRVSLEKRAPRRLIQSIGTQPVHAPAWLQGTI